MPAQRTVLRNTGVFTQAIEQGKSVRFTYTTAAGETRSRVVTPLHAKPTRHNKDALLIQAKDGVNERSFRTDRVLRARLV